MIFEEPQNSPDDKEREINPEDEINNSTSFSQAIEQGSLEQAENWLMAAKDSPEYVANTRWLDHRSRQLFRAFYEAGDYAGAKRMVDLANGEEKIAKRRARLEEVSGIPFDKI